MKRTLKTAITCSHRNFNDRHTQNFIDV